MDTHPKYCGLSGVAERRRWEFRILTVDVAVNYSDLIVLADVKQVRDLGSAPADSVSESTVVGGGIFSGSCRFEELSKAHLLDEIRVTYSLPVIIVE